MSTVFQFRNYGESLGTRAQGEVVRNDLLSVISQNALTVLDFEGVIMVSNSFADECIAKLLLVYSLDDLKQRTTFRGTNDFVRHCIAVALSRRKMAMEKAE